jgi:uncharacterized protein (DUF58 family)
MQDYRKYLNPENLSKIASLELKARLVVEGFITGLHKSPYHGFSVEFAEHRQYRSGDEIRHLDWKVYARTEKHYIKQYEEETNLRSMIAIDSSASMKYASAKNISKFEYASYLAAAIAYLLINQRDSAGIALYDEAIRSYFPASSRRSYLNEMLKAIDETEPSNSTGTAKSLDEIAERIRRRGLVVVISDFFDDLQSTLKALNHFKHKNHDIIVFQILDPREIDFKFGNSATFIDLESGEEMATQPHQIHKAYTDAVNKFTQDMKKGCRNLNIDYNLVSTDEPFDKSLREFIAKRSKMR